MGMRTAIFGSGSVGGYLGARLARAGLVVAFIARGEHLWVMRDHGLRVGCPFGDFTVHPVLATDEPAQVGHADAVLVGVKAWVDKLPVRDDVVVGRLDLVGSVRVEEAAVDRRHRAVGCRNRRQGLGGSHPPPRQAHLDAEGVRRDSHGIDGDGSARHDHLSALHGRCGPRVRREARA
jgi:choline dehydrogenase-like flavoprotein